MDRLEWCLPFTFRFTLQSSSTDAHDLFRHLTLSPGARWRPARCDSRAGRTALELALQGSQEPSVHGAPEP